MKAITFSGHGNLINDDEAMSFLPLDTERPKIRSNPSRERFCLPWMLNYIAVMILILCAVLLKVLHGHLTRHSAGEVAQWENLRLDNINNWCLIENTVACACASPLTPKSRHGHKTWTQAHLQNIKDAARRRDYPMDVVFLGDSITEGWKGTSFGQPVEHKKSNVQAFESMFDSKKGGSLNGLVLGIAGDKAPNLLWRVQNGELPKSLEAKVFWILIGTNDFLKDGLEHCSAEVVVMGVKRVVEEVRILKPNAKIVINQILPRAPGTHYGLLYEDMETRNVTIAIKKVNSELMVYCDQHDNVDCFDASDIFIRHNTTYTGVASEYIPNDLMRDHLHPTSNGYIHWGQKIVDKLHEIDITSETGDV